MDLPRAGPEEALPEDRKRPEWNDSSVEKKTDDKI